MAKYIDADKLKEVLKKSVYPSSRCGKTFNLFLEFVMRLIDDMPAADVVEVVRCKDCKYSKYKPIIGRLEEGEQTALLYCTMFVNGQHIYECDFCSYGERKVDNG